MRVVFISCVSDEFRGYRSALRQALTARNIEIKVQEDFADGGGTLLAKLDDYLRCCDAVIHLVGDGVGTAAKPAEVRDLLRRHPDLPQVLPELAPWIDPDSCPFSYTQWEAFLALYHRRDCYVFRATPASLREPGWQATPESVAAQHVHIDHLRSLGKDRSPPVEFRDARDIAIRFLKSFHDEDLDPVASLDPEPPSQADWAAFITWQQTRIDGLDLGLGRDTVLIDLDVEVERTTGLRASIRSLGKRRYRGRRVQQAILSLLKDAPRLPLLLEGEPGAGKSVALAQLANDALAHADKRKKSVPIPLFISLSRLPAPPDGQPATAEHILQHVIKSGAGLEGAEQGTGAAAIYERCLRFGLKQGRFRILFDGFDEIPALLAAEDSGQTAREYGLAIQAFAANPDFGQCQVVVASRPYRSPDALLWPKLRLKELDDKRIREAVDRRFGPKAPTQGSRQLADHVFQELVERWEMLGELLRNPLFLDLVCRYRADNDRPPETMADAFQGFVRRRLADDADRLAGMGLSPAAIESGAAEIAFRMTAERGLGLKPDPGLLLATLNDGSWTLEVPPERIVDVLIEVNLAGIERVDGAAEFRFKPHRRFHEYFATRAVLADPGRLTVSELLWGEKWRDTAVTLLETAELEDQYGVREELRRLTRDWAETRGLPSNIDGVPITAMDPLKLRQALQEIPRDNEARDFCWPDDSLHPLEILNNAGARGARQDPATAANVDRLLLAAFMSGKRLLQKTALELAHAGSRDGVLWLLNAAFESNSALLSNLAMEQAKLMPALPGSILPRIRESLAAQWARGELTNATAHVTRKRLKLLDPTRGLTQSLRLLNWTNRIDVALYCYIWLSWVIGVYVVAILNSPPQIENPLVSWGSVLIFGLLLGSIFFGLPMTLSYFGEAMSARTHLHLCSARSAADCAWCTRVFPRAIRRLFYLAGFAGLFYAVYDVNLVNAQSISLLGALHFLTAGPAGPVLPIYIFWSFWGFCAPLAALSGRFTAAWQWPLVVLEPFLQAKSTAGQIAAGLRRATASASMYTVRLSIFAVPVLGLLIFAGSTGLIERIEGIDPGRVTLAITAVLYLALLPAFVSDLRTSLLARGKRTIELSQAAYRLAVPSVSGPRVRLKLLRSLRSRSRLAATAGTERQLADMITAIGRDADKARGAPRAKPAPDSDWHPEVQAWYRKHARRSQGMAFLNGPVLDELLLLLDAVQNALRYPSHARVADPM